MSRLAGISLGLCLAAGGAMAAPDDALTRGFDDCFSAVTSGNGLFRLSAYEMVPQGADNGGERGFLGTLTSGLGDMAVSATIRDGQLVECTLGHAPQTVPYGPAEDSVAAWFGWLDSTGLSQAVEGEAQVSRVLCLPDLASVAVQVVAAKHGDAPEALGFAVALTTPDNFKQCG
ncbi:hypothetical protein PGB28_18645 [Primorskyibacter aestuariivivens]|uniref:hypothetical protein n=1 Tax=Primorskyibacter aestuariivivens TaxID=1888912 RepID=UPI0023015AE0|nr:hypothetical protein [Primorskyibacter aestuariivivens]MDA7430485.1 hypothetical protein [Primorskyibacter aestuariivivens]